MVRLSNLAAVAIASFAMIGNAQAVDLTTELVVSGLARPVWVGSPSGDLDRIFIVEQNAARIRIFNKVAGALNGVDFLNIAGKVTTSGNEQGLFSVAFDPDYANNRFFYVNYTRSGDAATIVERYQTFAANPDRADPASGTVMFGPLAQPFSNHNGGNLAFGPDGYLYIGTGDGGNAGDPQCRAQNGNVLLGKMLRVDVSTVPASAPASNPFVGNPAVNDLVWSLGLRNPWRYSFDPANGDLYIGDVGQNAHEEIDWVPGSSVGGENYGWKIMEGNACFSTSACPGGTPACNSPLFTDPVVDFSHAGGNCSVTGGAVYRGNAIPGFQGVYFYADYCSGSIWTFRLLNGVVTELVDRENELNPPGALVINNVTHIGPDGTGEMYIADQSGGEIYRVVPVDLAGFNLGFGKVGGNGLVPTLAATGDFGGAGVTLSLTDAAPNRLAILFGSVFNNPSNTIAGTLVPIPPQITVSLVTNANGEINLPVTGVTGPLTFNLQYAIDDPGAVLGAASSNAFAMVIP